MSGRLHPSRLPALPAAVRRPTYDRTRLRSGIVHLGLGAFMRAHLAPITDDAIEAGADVHQLGWGISGVSLRQAHTRDALAPQSGLYTLALRDAAGQRLRVVGCLRECLLAPDDLAAVPSRIAAADTRIVSLTITEKGYCHDPAMRRLRIDHPDIVHDLAHPAAPCSALGTVLHGLALRRAQGQGPLTLMSLDNLSANGDLLRSLLLDLAERRDVSLARWIDAGCTFPSSMVDRIVPRTTEADTQSVATALGLHDAWPVLAEPFVEWVVEDRFAAGRPDWSAAGVRFVSDVAPWERRKLRMVNGAHSTIAYLGMLAGWETVHEAVARPALRHHLRLLMRDEIEPTLDDMPGPDRADHRERLLERFANPALDHRTAQIAMDGSQKLPQRLLASVRERLAAGQGVDRLALGVAAWLHHLRGFDEQGRAYRLDDPLAAELQSLHRAAAQAPDVRAAAAHFTRFSPVFGDLADAPALVDALAHALRLLQREGVATTLARMT